ncbi:hypothetical protein Tco_1353038 [Tanacetum coccineum]
MVRTQKPTGLSQAMELALIIDETSKGVTPKAANRTGGDSSRPPAVVAGGASFKRMTNSEFTDKKAKGLCYRCDGKFLPGHRCPEKALQFLLMDDDEEEEIEGGYSVEITSIVTLHNVWLASSKSSLSGEYNDLPVNGHVHTINLIRADLSSNYPI